MNVGFIMDPMEHIQPKKDTSYAMMVACVKKGHSIYYIPNSGCGLKTTHKSVDVTLNAAKIKLDDHNRPLCRSYDSDLSPMHATDFDVLIIRTDPPFNDTYIYNTWVLDHIKEKPFVFNRPSSIRTVNEKIWATQFHDLIPETCISSSISDCLDFINVHKKCVLKPINGFGGQSIFIVEKDDVNKSALCETLTENGKTPIICQKYLAAAKQGDKRILLCDGEPLGAVLRMHSKTDHRNNFFAGGQAEKTQITEHDFKIIERLSPHLKALGLFFVGIDIIGDKLIEVNVTSPTCIQEMASFMQSDPIETLLDAIEAKAKN